MRIKSNAGYSITEILVATVIISVVAYSVLTAFPALKKQASSFRNVGSCRAYLDRAFTEIEEHGFRARVPAGTDMRGVTLNLLPTRTLNGVNVTPLEGQRALGQGTGNWTNSDQLTDIRTPGLVVGTAALVNRLYNNASSACGTDTIYNTTALTATPFPQPPDDIRDGFALRVAIAPYDIQTRTQACSNSAFAAVPASPFRIPGIKGLHNTAAGVNSQAQRSTVSNPTAPNGVARFNASINPDMAFLVTLGAEFDVRDSTGFVSKKSCRESRLVGYTSDLQRPVAPTISLTYVAGARSYPKWGADSATLTVNYSGTEPGVSLFCRDYSGYAVPSPPPGLPGKMYPASLVPAPRANRWVPCEKVTLCGSNNGPGTGPSNGGTATITAAPGPAYAITKVWTYPNFPVRYGCIARVSAIAVDMAGNVSAESYGSVNINE